MTQEQIRIQILNKRLRLLTEYLERFSDGNGPTFAQFIKRKGVSHAAFIKDLPPGYENVPASGYDNILEYALSLHGLLEGQHRIVEMEQIAADGNNLEAGNIHYQPNQYTPNQYPSDCGCGGGCGKHSADGEEEFNAIGGLCIKPMAPLLSIKLAPGQWRSYENKKKVYNECLRKKAELKASGKDKAKHLFNLTNLGVAPIRLSFLKLVALNVFGLAQIFERMRKDPNQTHWNQVKAKFYNFGGTDAKLDSNVSIGHSKKPVFRPKGWKPKGATTNNGADGSFSADGQWYNAEAYTAAGIAAIITAAAGFTAQLTPIIKNFKKEKGEVDDFNPEGTPDANYPGDLPDPGDDGSGDGGMLSNINWAIAAPVAIVLLAGIGFAIYKATK